MTRVLIADDHPLFRAALGRALAQCLPDAEVNESQTLAETLESLEGHPDTDLVLLDLMMPGSKGLAGLAAIRCHHPTVAVVVVSGMEDARVVRRVLDHGAAGFIPKSARLEDITAALEAVLDCREWVPPHLADAGDGDEEDAKLAARMAALTPQQFRVLELVSEGLLNKQIAYELGVQERTIKAHMTEILGKLGVNNRTQASIAFRKLELSADALPTNA